MFLSLTSYMYICIKMISPLVKYIFTITSLRCKKMYKSLVKYKITITS